MFFIGQFCDNDVFIKPSKFKENFYGSRQGQISSCTCAFNFFCASLGVTTCYEVAPLQSV